MKILYSGLNGIQITRFFQNARKITFFSVFSQLFSKKELENTKYINKITKQKTNTNKFFTISSIIIALLLFLIHCHFEKLYEGRQPISQLRQVAKLFIYPKNSLIAPLLSLWLNDNDIIWGIGLGCENESIGQGRSYAYINISISNCFFSRYLSYSGDGGVIYAYGSYYSMNIDYSMFYNCICSQNGGAIHFTSTNSSLRMICANSCKAPNYHFSYLKASQVNQVVYLSVSNCSHTASGYYSIYLYTGDQRVDNTNSSMNNVFSYSGISISSPSSFTSSHCTYSNNKASVEICISIYSTSGTISMSYVNIVHNNSPSDYGVVRVNGAGSRLMIYCIFHNNHDCLFCAIGGSLEVSHSFIDHSGSFSISTAVSTTNNNSFINRITYQLQFFNSHHCNADIPLPQRTPDQSPTPKITPEESPINSPGESPMNTPEETPMNTPEESPINTPGDTPMNTLNESPINTPEETPMNTLNESPINTPEETPMNTPEESPINTPGDTPMNTLNDTPLNTPKETPLNTPEESPINTPEETPMNSPEESPINSPEESPMNSPEESPINSPEESPINSLEESPMNSLEESPINSPEKTPMNSLEESPINSPEESPMNSLEESPINSPEESPINSPEETPMNSLEESPMNSPEESPMNNNQSANSFRLVFISLSIIVVIISFVYALGLVLNSKLESSNISNSKSEGNIPSSI